MQGRRIDPPPHSWGTGACPFQPGDYWKEDDGWHACCPDGQLANLSSHHITEHVDGTITVQPSILVRGGPGEIWHGYLQNGQWSQC